MECLSRMFSVVTDVLPEGCFIRHYCILWRGKRAQWEEEWSSTERDIKICRAKMGVSCGRGNRSVALIGSVHTIFRFYRFHLRSPSNNDVTKTESSLPHWTEEFTVISVSTHCQHGREKIPPRHGICLLLASLLLAADEESLERWRRVSLIAQLRNLSKYTLVKLINHGGGSSVCCISARCGGEGGCTSMFRLSRQLLIYCGCRSYWVRLVRDCSLLGWNLPSPSMCLYWHGTAVLPHLTLDTSHSLLCSWCKKKKKK